jgi:CDP-diacylglycerol---glycerol-3-phosphate 3-phosphatidyltransferase
MNVPNLLTLARIFLVPVFLFALLTRVPIGSQIAAAVFVVAAITDGVDGYLARKNKEITRLGQFLDPLADKLLISAALIALVELKQLSTWVTLVIIGREMAVTGLRSIAAAEGVIIAAGSWGKAKTVLQIIFVVDAILLNALPQTWWLRTLAALLFQPALWLAVALTIWSGVDYLVGYYRGLKQPPQGVTVKPLRFRLKLPLRRKRV